MSLRLAGTLDATHVGWKVPKMSTVDRAELSLGKIELLQVMYEIRCGDLVDLVPFALQPSIPASATWLAFRCDESPWGPFRLVMTRVTARSGIRPRGLVTSAYVDNSDAARELRNGWGYPTTVADVCFKRAYQGISVTVEHDGRRLLDLRLVDPEVVAVTPFVSANLHLVDLPEGRRAIQVDPTIEFAEVQRGRPELRIFSGDMAPGVRLEPVHPIHAVYGVGTIDLPRLRWYFDPDRELSEGMVEFLANSHDASVG